MAIDSTVLSSLDAAITSAIANGSITVSQITDAAGNSLSRVDLLKLLESYEYLASISTKNSRTSSFDKFKFSAK